MKTFLIAALGLSLFASAAFAQGDQAPGTTGSKITTPGQSGSETPRAQPGASPTLPTDGSSAGSSAPASTTTNPDAPNPNDTKNIINNTGKKS